MMNQTVLLLSIPSSTDNPLLNMKQNVRTVQTETDEIVTDEKFTQIPEISKDQQQQKQSPELLLSFLRRTSPLMESLLNENTIVQMNGSEQQQQQQQKTESPSNQSESLFSRSVLLRWSELTNGRSITSMNDSLCHTLFFSLYLS